MKITIIGSGYVGLVTAACLSETGNDVFCLDLDEKKIAMLVGGQVPIYEPGLDVTVFEKDPQYVGGISRTESYKGYHFDIGGHRFFSKSKEVEDFWTEILNDELLERPRSSRIFLQ